MTGKEKLPVHLLDGSLRGGKSAAISSAAFTRQKTSNIHPGHPSEESSSRNADASPRDDRAHQEAREIFSSIRASTKGRGVGVRGGIFDAFAGERRPKGRGQAISWKQGVEKEKESLSGASKDRLIIFGNSEQTKFQTP